MPFYLIGIKKPRWIRDKKATWLTPPEIPATVYMDLRLTGNCLSVWHIEDDQSNLTDVVVALATTKISYDVFDYGLFDQNIVTIIPIKVVVTNGKTPALHSNHWHRDLVELTTTKVTALIAAFFDAWHVDRLSMHKVRESVIGALRSNQIDVTGIQPQLLADLSYVGVVTTMPRVINDDIWIDAQCKLVEHLGIDKTLSRMREQFRQYIPDVRYGEKPGWLESSMQEIAIRGSNTYFQQVLRQVRAELGL